MATDTDEHPLPIRSLRGERAILGAGLFGAAGLFLAGALAPGPLSTVAFAGIEVAPLLLVGWLARLGGRRPWAQCAVACSRCSCSRWRSRS